MAATERPQLLPIRVTPGAETAVVFIHGFSGSAGKTWGRFPEHLSAEPRLNGWDLLSLGYRTGLSFDIPGIWRALPDLTKLAGLLRTTAGLGDLKRYRVLSFVAHSMGGLVTQKALVDDPDLADRTGHVVLFGTPSGGLRTARWIRALNRQVGDMAKGGPFIKALRSDWTELFGAAPSFSFLSVAGDRDEFVPGSSSLDPFPDAQRAVVYGDHLEIVKPATADDLSVRVLIGFLAGDGTVAGPWNSARIAVERKNFQAAVDQLWPHRTELDDQNVAHLAIALESLDRSEDAVRLLETHAADSRSGTDPLGVLGGRLKRRWLAEGRSADAERALELYGRGLELSTAAADHEQAFYHAINVAFLNLAFNRDRKAARELARTALDHCACFASEEGEDHWSLATRGEAHLLLKQDDESLAAYAQAIEREPEPWQLGSMFVQADRIAEILGRKETRKRLEELFRPRAEPVADDASEREDRS